MENRAGGGRGVGFTVSGNAGTVPVSVQTVDQEESDFDDSGVEELVDKFLDQETKKRSRCRLMRILASIFAVIILLGNVGFWLYCNGGVCCDPSDEDILTDTVVVMFHKYNANEVLCDSGEVDSVIFVVKAIDVDNDSIFKSLMASNDSINNINAKENKPDLNSSDSIKKGVGNMADAISKVPSETPKTSLWRADSVFLNKAFVGDSSYIHKVTYLKRK